MTTTFRLAPHRSTNIHRNSRAHPIAPGLLASMGMVRAPLLQRHIDQGLLSDCHRCPVAIALDEATACATPTHIPFRADAAQWAIYSCSATFLPRGSLARNYTLGPELQGWITRFDTRTRRSVRPAILQLLEDRIELVHEEPTKALPA